MEKQRKVRRGQDKNHAVLFYTPNPRKIADISHHFIYGMKINKGHCACMGGIPKGGCVVRLCVKGRGMRHLTNGKA